MDEMNKAAGQSPGRFDFFKRYFSTLGLKIAVAVGLCLFLSTAAYIFFHEYRLEGNTEFYKILASPFLWVDLAVFFIIFMIILSELVILPLKMFDNHIKELEKGAKKGPFLLRRNDEIGHLTDRFNNLHRIVTEKIETREVQLSVLHKFTDATSGIFDIHTLMDNFFNILRGAVEFDVGGFLLNKNNVVEGRIYSTFDVLGEGDIEDLRRSLTARAAELCPGFPGEEGGEPLEVSTIYGVPSQSSAAKGTPSHFVDLPIICFGEPVGVVSLVSFSGTGTNPVKGSRVYNAMVRHTSAVIERLFLHISEEERRLSDILSSMSEGVYIIDKAGHASAMNDKAVELAGKFCNMGLACNECIKSGGTLGLEGPNNGKKVKCDFSRLLQRIRGFDLAGKVYTEEMKNDDGITIQISVCEMKMGDNKKEGYVVTATDVTEERLIQKRVMLSSKLAALGEMAAGIAHEVNNPLQVMMANIELLESVVGEQAGKRIDHLKDGIFRVKSIVKDLLIFAREQTTEVEDVDVNEMIRKASDMLGHQLKVANVEIELDLDRRSLVARCNKNLFQQVIINLLQNARDAIEESGKGTRVGIRSVLLPGGIVVVEFSDDGPGIPEEVVDRIFDPFFTTKDVGKGTGLGLSVSRRIIEGMGGSITVASSPTRGTTFTITLIHNSSTRRRRDRIEHRKSGTPARDYTILTGKSVIVVDDEDGVVKAVKEAIGPKVASIESASDGARALEMIVENEYDLILTDIKMAGMNGMELYRRINEVKPYLAQRMIFLTGDLENEATESFIKLTGCPYLAKPFTMAELMDVMCGHETEVCR